ncbi:MAG: hypothetical protein HFG66_04645 [Hungatella sp.]|nr:hypothetical protein [Hungatella sp.]
MLTDTRKSPYAKVHGISHDAVKLMPGFWKECLEVCATGTVPQIGKLFEDSNISHVVENFRICAGECAGRHRGTPFGDGDFYKWLEAVLYCGVLTGEDRLLEQADSYIRLIARAQRPDGYLSTKQIISEMTGGGDTRQKDINEFEVYNFGHLFTLASLHKRLTVKDDLLHVARKAAGYLDTLYTKAEKSGQVRTAVCPSHHMGLVELYRTTKDPFYRELAIKAMRIRDLVEDGMDDNQDRIPLAQQETLVGHAVRANYLYAGLADLYAETGEREWLEVLGRMWKSLTEKKMYITGGCGAIYNGASPYGNFFKDQKVHQAYGYEYQLPNITAYNETCASIGAVMWAYRMFTVDPKAEYMDTLERMMYNVNLGAVSLDGKRFFYENMLRRTRELDYELVWPRERTEYIKSFCCPPNVSRLLAQVGEYFYTVSGDTVWAGLYGASESRISLAGGMEFTICQETEYPYDGRIRFTFTEVKTREESQEKPWKLMLRIPGWAAGGSLRVNGERKRIVDSDAGTYLCVEITDTREAAAELSLDMPARLTVANSMVEETENHVAVERGPLVYCMESPDADVDTLDDLLLPADARFETEPIWVEGRKMTALKSVFFSLERDRGDKKALYQTLGRYKKVPREVRLIPYFAWDNRGMGEMRIWFPAGY